MNLQRNPTDRPSSWDWRAALSAGRLAQDSGDLGRAEVRFREAADLARTAGSHDGLQESLNALGVVLARQDRLDEAESVLRQAIVGTSDDPIDQKASSARSNLAEVLSRKGRTEEAISLMRDVLDVQTHPTERAAALNNMAVIFAEKEDYAEAIALLREGLAITRSALGPEHPTNIRLLVNLGMALRNAADWEEGTAALEHALRLSEMALGPDHPQTHALRTSLSVG